MDLPRRQKMTQGRKKKKKGSLETSVQVWDMQASESFPLYTADYASVLGCDL